MRFFFKIFFLLQIFTFLLHAQIINVAVAANVSYAIESLKKEFQKLHPDTQINITLASSGKLAAQIKHGAPYDIFMSADMKYPQSLFEEKFTRIPVKVYAKGTLALLSKTPQKFSNITKLLQDSGIKKIAIANPKTAPYGIAAVEALKHMKLLSTLQSKLVYGESISQTLSYTLYATDLGFVATSLLLSPKMKNFKANKHFVELDPKFYTPIKQGIILLKKAKNYKAAREFYEFILSEKAQKIFQQYGYLKP